MPVSSHQVKGIFYQRDLALWSLTLMTWQRLWPSVSLLQKRCIPCHANPITKVGGAAPLEVCTVVIVVTSERIRSVEGEFQRVAPVSASKALGSTSSSREQVSFIFMFPYLAQGCLPNALGIFFFSSCVLLKIEVKFT